MDDHYEPEWKQNQENAVIMQCFFWAAHLEIADLLQSGPKHVCDLASFTHTCERSLHRLLQVLARRKVFAEAEPGVFALTEEGEKMKRGGLRSRVILKEKWNIIDAEKEWWVSVEGILFQGGLDWDTLFRLDL